MKYLLAIIFIFTLGNTHSQTVSLEDGNIWIKIEIAKVNDTTFNYVAAIENKGQVSIYLYQAQEAQKSYLKNYVGIGLYSQLYPYLPIHTEKFKDFNCVQIKPNSKSTAKGTFVWRDKKSITIALDYYIDKKRKYKGKTNISIDLETYDKCLKKSKAEFNLN